MHFFKVSLIVLFLLGGFAVQAQKIFLVIDDAGLALHETQQFLDIPVSMTIAVLPHQKQTKQVCIAIGRDRNKEIILHQPMEAYNDKKNPGVGAIMNTTPPSEVRKILDQNFRSVRGAVGMNNHMGSRVTENPELIREMLRFCKAHDMFFLDSKTAYNSQVPRIAKENGMHVEERHVFLDINHDRAYIRRMWGSAVNKAKENGYVIVIAHVWSKESAAAIRDSYEGLLNQGYTFHKLSELYK
ncbi:divergent polysaccharide deacetylase family protein [Pontiella agarivorans]|uniref:Divergent polysaccharide deacetylase family protein n=1 Tax=Pontiella agarivorans TaxID=3038953 RepID=A0ABU5MSC9_9BACT|nr:divergent polysaccharide deacetylase family protein [Pontiella agarivorans]MDZ8117100.1 divergent polysaccharide deacetylase family protein [Pontiella agarivorans]